MKSVYHPADSRGFADHGWLKSFHTFSFSGYHDPERMHFGLLRVLNDDLVAPGRGFGRHPHNDMEIISIPLEGELVHQDSLGNKSVIRRGDIQVMSAGTGVEHSEFNNSGTEPVQFLQIWIFPHSKGLQPRYDQQRIPEVPNTLAQVLSPSPENQGVWINQQAWFWMGSFDRETSINHSLQNGGNGFYVFVLEGQVRIGDQPLQKRDGLGIWETDAITLDAQAGARILLMDIPMNQAR